MEDRQTDEEIVRFIELYRSQENLYNIGMKSYYDRDKTRESLLWIGVEMKKGWSVDTVQKKIKWLRDGYAKNLRLLLKNSKSGAALDDVNVRWKWFKMLDFLRPHSRVTVSGVTNMVDAQEDSQAYLEATPSISLPQAKILSPVFDLDLDPESVRGDDDEANATVHAPSNRCRIDSGSSSCTSASRSCSSASRQSSQAQSSRSKSPTPQRTHSPPDFSLSTPCKKRRVAEPSRACKLLEEVVERQKQKAYSENNNFGSFIAAEVDKLSPLAQLRVKKQITDILFEASMEELEGIGV